ncbi:MAG: hypothetical protein QOG87_3136 [Actinomycetota bacterium]|jgi:uncharacterized protein (TIGR00290 family)
MSWSSGKDSTFALHAARHELGIDVSALLCTVNADADRVAMHAVRRDLLLAQGERLGLPVHVVEIPSPCPDRVYEAAMRGAVDAALADGAEQMIFGDLYLRDVRAYREQHLAGTGLQPVFPLWERPTGALARDMIDSGLRAVLTCVDPAQLAPEFAGRTFDDDLLADLPADVDPCGENGEFHTFVYDGPGFRSAIDVQVGETVERDGFVFCDVGAA